MPGKIMTRLAPADADPLSLAPPIFETLEERNHRLAIERHAKEVSDAIDAELERERLMERKNPKPVKILLLGAWSATNQRYLVLR